MNGIRSYITQRRREILSQIEALNAELSELNAAEDAVKTTANERVLDLEESTDSTTIGSRLTIKEMVLEVLGVLPAGADANKILRLINQRYDRHIARTSLSPQLSRLRQEGYVRLDGSTWRIANAKDLFAEVKKAPARPNQASALEESDGAWSPSGLEGSDESEP